MIQSEQILTDSKFPDFIKLSSAFKNGKSYPKIFPSLGLSNFKCNLNDVRMNVLFALRSGVTGVKIDTQDLDCSVIKKGLFKVLGLPIFIGDMMVSLLEANKLKKRFEDKKLRVVFSSEGHEGAWDIATMSMRGIESCQSWHCRRAHHLIGSITDPCCAVMYLEDEEDSLGYGSRMLYRTVVRYVIHEEFGPYLFMEQVYPYEEDEAIVNGINTIFALELYKRSKMTVLYKGFALGSSNLKLSLMIPESEAVRANTYSASYRDSNIPYKSLSYVADKFPKLASLKEKFFN